MTIFSLFFRANFLTFFNFQSGINTTNFVRISTKNLQLKKISEFLLCKVQFAHIELNLITYLLMVEINQRRTHADFKNHQIGQKIFKHLLYSKHDYLHINHLFRLLRQTVPDKYHNKYY